MPMPKRQPGPPPLGHVVKEFTIGNTRVKICDDYCRNQTREEAEQIMRNFCRVCLPYLQQAEYKRMQEEAAAAAQNQQDNDV